MEEMTSVAAPKGAVPEKIIELKNVSKLYGSKAAVKEESLIIHKGEFVTLLGPSGCGKTTTLRMIAGFEIPTSGQIFYNGVDITELPPHKRSVNTVFQKYALFPHLNVFQNVAFGLKLKRIYTGGTRKQFKWFGKEVPEYRKFSKAEIAEKVNRALKMVDLEDYGKRDVSSLSGGQQQRIAIARALVNEPEVLLLDEPLGALDLKMRKDMQLELKAMHHNLGITFVYVTHDQEEALTMSDRIVIMKDGVIQQIGTPKEIYDEPANAFVADFIGESNIFSGVMLDDYKVRFADTDFTCVDFGFKPNEPVDIIIRPEDVYLVKQNAEKAQAIAVVTGSVFKGDHYDITIEMNGNEMMVNENFESKVGETVGVFIRPDDMHIMHKERIVNSYETEVNSDGTVTVCNADFKVEGEWEEGTKVLISVPFNGVEVTDNEDDGAISATVVSSIYKGSYYQVILRTDYDYDFFVDTTDEWLKGDRVGINLCASNITVTPIQAEAGEEDGE